MPIRALAHALNHSITLSAEGHFHSLSFTRSLAGATAIRIPRTNFLEIFDVLVQLNSPVQSYKLWFVQRSTRTNLVLLTAGTATIAMLVVADTNFVLGANWKKFSKLYFRIDTRPAKKCSRTYYGCWTCPHVARALLSIQQCENK